MAESRIEWTDKVWNPTTGCSRVSAGCDSCYAMHFARRFDGEGRGFDGTTRRSVKGTDWSGVANLHEDRLELPLHWRKPRRVFVDSMSDLFHPAVPFDFVHKVFCVMLNAPRHTFQILTKRPERMLKFMRWELARAEQEVDFVPLPLPNVWLGTSVENQEAADKRIQPLLETPAAVRFLSCEPLLGPVSLFDVGGWPNPATWWGEDIKLGWVIVGGESGRQARPMRVEWARDLRDQCNQASVPFFFKQWGEWFPRDQWEHNPDLVLPDDHVAYNAPDTDTLKRLGIEVHHRVGKKVAGRLLDGVEHSAFPEVAS